MYADINNQVDSQDKQFDTQDLTVVGYECKKFRDDASSILLHNEKHLINWNDDKTLTIDRFDVRSCINNPELLKKYKKFARLRQKYDENDPDIEYLYYERYRDIEGKDDSDMSEHENNRNSLFSYDYDTNDIVKKSIENDSVGMIIDKKDLFIPSFPIPPNYIIPTSLKQHEIIEKTANFVISQGAQAELILKVKQSSEPKFSFINNDDVLFPYYQYLIKHGFHHDPSFDIYSSDEGKEIIQKDQISDKDQLKLLAGYDDEDYPLEKLPPPSMKKACDTLANFIIKRGPQFEEIVKNKHKDSPDFEFLFENNQYHEYYLWKIDQLKTAQQEEENTSVDQISLQPKLSKAQKNLILQKILESQKQTYNTPSNSDVKPLDSTVFNQLLAKQIQSVKSRVKRKIYDAEKIEKEKKKVKEMFASSSSGEDSDILSDSDIDHKDRHYHSRKKRSDRKKSPSSSNDDSSSDDSNSRKSRKSSSRKSSSKRSHHHSTSKNIKHRHHRHR